MLVADLIKRKGTDIFSVTAGEPVTTAIALLCAKRIGAALVLDEDGAVAGIISERDLVRAMNRYGRGIFDKKAAKRLIDRQAELSAETGCPSVLHLYARSIQAFQSYLDFQLTS